MAGLFGSAWRAFWSQISGSRIGLGLLISSPAIFAWLAGLVLELSVDGRLRPLRAEIEQVVRANADLENFVTRFENTELDRGISNLQLSAVNAPPNYRYLADNFYRANSGAIGSLRRAAAVVYPDSWQDVLAPYEKTIAEGYNSPEQVAQLQEVDNAIMAESRKRIVIYEQQLTNLHTEAGALEHTRRWITMILQPLGLIFSVIAFVYNLKPRGSSV